MRSQFAKRSAAKVGCKPIAPTLALCSHTVIIVTEGCAFLSKALSCNVLHGDGYLFAVEVGARMSWMEFLNLGDRRTCFFIYQQRCRYKQKE
ncbi:hypothetical protein FM036_39565 [Nostoc sp. HG1]|nr:hypothetical protein [Nostoc sp. HG1]